MKKYLFLIAFLAIFKSFAQTPIPKDTIKGSSERDVSGTINGTKIKIVYHSPAVRGRIIWGGLVAFDQVWVTGAHNATAFEFDKDIKIDDTRLKAGKYAIFTIPSKDEWTFIINKNWNQHLADEYDPKLHLVRVKVKPEILDTHTERLAYNIDSEKKQITMTWEKLRLAIDIKKP